LLGTLGVTVARHDPPRTRAQRVRAVLGERGGDLATRLDALDRARYAPGMAAPSLGRWWRGFAKAALKLATG
jgi:hypothetical protein